MNLKTSKTFPSATLVSSEWVTHGTGSVVEADPDPNHTCLDHTLRYFQTGVVAAADGTVCDSPIPESSQLVQA